ncbi:MAG: hypothetical protein CR997_07375 [Acidobacteria bacterium]|nr:MAG: hypothetical protein CR997_07375 [Acidobacteriota bacterium]
MLPRFLLPFSLLSGCLLGFTYQAGIPLSSGMCVFFSLLSVSIALPRKKQTGQCVLIVLSLMIGYGWTSDYLRQSLMSLPGRQHLAKAYFIESTAVYTYETEFGFSTVMQDIRILRPDNAHFNLPRLSVFYHDESIFKRGSRARYWVTLKKSHQPQTVPSVFHRWSARFRPSFVGTIKDPRLIETERIPVDKNLLLSEGNRELVHFFTQGRSTKIWSERLSPFGVGHLLAISGLHCALFYLFLRLILIPLRLPLLRNAIITIALLLFTSRMGWSASVTRAAFMLLIWELMPSFNIKRNWMSIWWSLLLCLVLWDPVILLSRGFWYTFTASMGLIAGSKTPLPLEHPWLSKCRWVLPIFAAQLCVLPLNLLFTATSKPFSILWNLFGLLFLFLLFILFLFAFLSFLFSPVTLLANKLEALVVSVLDGLSPTTEFLAIYRFPEHPLIVYLFISLTLIALFYMKREWRWALALVLSVLFTQLNRPQSGESLTMVDCGQGQCILIAFQNGGGIIFDAGGRLLSGFKLTSVAKLYGIKRLKSIYLSHANRDHYSLVPQSKNTIPLYIPLSQEGVFSHIEALASCDLTTLKKGDLQSYGDWKVHIIWPDGAVKKESLNDSGLILVLSNGRTQILLTGDAGMDVESCLQIERRDLPLIIQAGHHGSRNSSSHSFLKRVDPSLALISAGRENPFNHPHSETLKRLKKLHIPYRITAEEGTIRVDLSDY